MKHTRKLCIAPGEIWAVAASDSALRSEWCARFARDLDGPDDVAILNFAQQAETAQKTGWPQARYYETGGETVEEFLSFNSTYDVIPFEVGARYPETRKAYRRRLDGIMRLLDLRRFAKHQVISLYNGETRRLLLASALAKRPKMLVLDDLSTDQFHGLLNGMKVLQATVAYKAVTTKHNLNGTPCRLYRELAAEHAAMNP